MSATVSSTRDVRFSELLKRVWPKHAAKHAATAADCSVRTAQAWLADRCAPSWTALHRMATNNDRLRAELLRALEGTTSNEDHTSVRATATRPSGDDARQTAARAVAAPALAGGMGQD